MEYIDLLLLNGVYWDELQPTKNNLLLTSCNIQNENDFLFTKTSGGEIGSGIWLEPFLFELRRRWGQFSIVMCLFLWGGLFFSENITYNGVSQQMMGGFSPPVFFGDVNMLFFRIYLAPSWRVGLFFQTKNPSIREMLQKVGPGSSYKRSYSPYKWPQIKRVTGVISPYSIGVISPYLYPDPGPTLQEHQNLCSTRSSTLLVDLLTSQSR